MCFIQFIYSLNLIMLAGEGVRTPLFAIFTFTKES